MKMRMILELAKLKAKDFKRDEKGAGKNNFISAIILLSIAAIFIGSLFLEALNLLGGAINTSSPANNITGTTLVLYGLITVILVIAVIILILEAAGIKIN